MRPADKSTLPWRSANPSASSRACAGTSAMPAGTYSELWTSDWQVIDGASHRCMVDPERMPAIAQKWSLVSPRIKRCRPACQTHGRGDWMPAANLGERRARELVALAEGRTRMCDLPWLAPSGL
jgi:hypothetical protein